MNPEDLVPMNELEGSLLTMRFNRLVDELQKMVQREFPGSHFAVQVLTPQSAPMFSGTLSPPQVIGMLAQLWHAQMHGDPSLRRIATERPPT